MKRQVLAVLALVISACGITGCASYEAFDPGQTSVDADSYVVAMSINTLAQGGKPVQADQPLFLMNELGITGKKPIDIYELQPGLGLLVLEVPGDELNLGNLQMSWRMPGYGWQVFLTAKEGPKVSLEPGVVNYLGSLVIAGSRIEGDSNPRPTSIDLRFVDAWEADAEIWKEHFAVFAANDPNKVISGSWADTGYVTLRAVTGRGQSVADTGSPIRSYQENPRRMSITRAVRQPY